MDEQLKQMNEDFFKKQENWDIEKKDFATTKENLMEKIKQLQQAASKLEEDYAQRLAQLDATNERNIVLEKQGEKLKQDYEKLVKVHQEQKQAFEVLEDRLKLTETNLEETEKQLNEEKDQLELFRAEENGKRKEMEEQLKQLNEEIFKKQENWAIEKKNFATSEENLMEKIKEFQKVSSKLEEDYAQQVAQLDAANKRNLLLEKQREKLKQDQDELAQVHQQQKQALEDEIKTTKKQCEVLSKTAVEDKDIAIERKLEELRKDFEARLLSKDSENTQNISILTKKFCSQMEENKQIYEEQLEKMKRKHLSVEDSLRAQHHKEIISLQEEIFNKDKELESCVEKYEVEMHQMDYNMSSLVDKATFRALEAEKKLLEGGLEKENSQLKEQLGLVKKDLAIIQARDCENLSKLSVLEARMSLATPLADPEKLEYLRRIMFEYMMGNENKTMAKVIIVLLQFNDLQAQQILEKHSLSQEWLAKRVEKH